MQRYFILLISILFLANLTFAQVSSETQTQVISPLDSTKAKNGSPKERKTKIKKEKEPYRFMANVHGGVGIVRFFGDVIDRDNVTVHTLGNRPAFSFGVGANVTNYLELNIEGLYGWLNGNENNYSLHRNFEAEMFGVGASLTYNFRNLLRSPVGITPFISVGASYTDYRVFTDVLDVNSETYHYWDDGLIRNVSQLQPASDDIRILNRDYEYETRLSQNPVTAVAFPVGVGFDFNASRKVAIRLGATYYFTATDLIDNVSESGSGLVSTDGYLMTSLSFIYRFDPFKKKAPQLLVADDDLYTDLTETENKDSDGDGVVDFLDQCSATPLGVPVDGKGCPFDRDSDGIADYYDKQLNTPPGALVDPDGVALSYQDIYKKYQGDSVSLLRSEINDDFLYSQKEKNPNYTVHIGTFTNDDIPTQLKKKLSQMPGLVERKINDSTSVFTVGTFTDFAQAEKQQNDLREQGVAQAFGVNDKAVIKVAADLKKVDNGESFYERPKIDGVNDEDVLTYGVELREYRLRIELDKLSKLIGQYGVEMKVTTGGVKVYTIGSFATKAEAEKLQAEVASMGVKESAVTAKFNNATIELEDAVEIEQKLNEKK